MFSTFMGFISAKMRGYYPVLKTDMGFACYHQNIGVVMENNDKLKPLEIACLAVIVLIMLYFPCLMISEHIQDNTANSYYNNGR